MIRGFFTSDLFNSKPLTLVNATNTEGIMGAGIALRFKQLFPDMYAEYVAACERREHTVVRPHLWRGFRVNVLNVATKDRVYNPSQLYYVESGLSWIAEHYAEEWLTSLAVPALGCGLGGLSWDDVEPMIISYLDPLPIPVEVYLPR